MATEALHFSIDGEYITQLAREKYYYDKSLKSAIDIIKSATMTDQLTENEHLLLCLEIIAGKKSIVGVYPSDDYGIEETDPTIDINDFFKTIDDDFKKAEDLKSEYNKTLQKYSFVLSQLDEYELRNIARRYHDDFNERLFERNSDETSYSYTDYLADLYENNIPDLSDESDLSSFIKHISDTNEYAHAEYGWLEPDGAYHEVDWGNHSDWAVEYCKEHYPFPKYAEMYWKTDSDGNKHHYVNGDFLVYILGWVLIDSPFQGQGTPKSDPARDYTKAQREFLYDYFIERNRNTEANALYEID